MFRIFVDGPINIGERRKISDSESHHLRVLRKEDGDQVEVVNGIGEMGLGIIRMDGLAYYIDICNRVYKDNDAVLNIVMPVLKNKKDMVWIAEKLCEIGVKNIYIFDADRSIYKGAQDMLVSKMKNNILAAIKQSKRVWLPEVSFIALETLFVNLSYDDTVCFGSLCSYALPISSWWNELKKKRGDVWFVSGPEAGFSEEEEKMLKERAIPVSLGKYVLRAENAPIVFSAMMLGWIEFR